MSLDITLGQLLAAGIPSLVGLLLIYFARNAFEDIRGGIRELKTDVGGMKETLADRSKDLALVQQRQGEHDERWRTHEGWKREIEERLHDHGKLLEGLRARRGGR